MRALITGGAGFIGSHLAEALLDAGHEVPSSTTCRPARSTTSRTSRAGRGFEYFIDTVDNEPLLAELIDRSDVVFHLAAAVGVKLIVEQPVHTIETNVHGTEVVLKHANKKKKLVVIASTSEVYGKSDGRAVPRGLGSGAGPDAEAPLGLRVQQGDRRVPRARLLEGDASCRSIIVRLLQHRRAAADRAVRDGDPELRAAGARRASRSPCSATARRRAASPTSRDVVGALLKLVDEPKAIGQVFNIGNTRGDHDHARSPSASRR